MFRQGAVLDSFRWLTVAFSMILGLGVAKLLTNAVGVFTSRTRVRIDWVPLAWAASIFVMQIQFWWAIIELSAKTGGWTIGHFLLLLSLPLVLFVAAALVLPSEESPEDKRLMDWFDRDGRWALPVISAYYVLAVVTNWTLFDAVPLSYQDNEEFVLAALPLAYIFTGARRWRALITILFLLLNLWVSWDLSPKAY
jgi:hypothetical protein